MSAFGPSTPSPIAQSLAQVPHADRVIVRAAERRAAPAGKVAKKDEDRFDAPATEAEAAAAVRRMSSNEQEDAREDHQEHPSYSPHGTKRAPAPAKRFDASA